MDPDLLSKSKSNAPRKVKFAPKAPPKREAKLVLPKAEKFESDVEDSKAEQLLRRLNETSLTGKAKAERKGVKTQVAFGFGGSSSLKSYGSSKKINRNGGLSSADGAVEKEYREPWDYYSYYPVTLPLRRPYSGNPELIDRKEFDEDPQSTSYNENETNHAAELGLLDDNEEDTMFLIQLPQTLPMTKQSKDTEVAEPGSSSNPRKDSRKSQQPCSLEDLPEGFMGKMLVYRSGAVKLKLGDMLYDVSAGLDCSFAQDAVAINTENGFCCSLGEINKRAVVTPDIDSLLDNLSDA